MNKLNKGKIYEFEDFRLDSAHFLLVKNGEEIPLTRKVVETLLALVERSGKVLSKNELMDIIWGDSFVEEGNLMQNLYILRKVLHADNKLLIETLKRRGYRFNGNVVISETDISPSKKTASNSNLRNNHTQQNSFQIIGRETEIAEIKNLLLQDEVSLVTLAGVGGTGKTKLAQAITRELAENFADGIKFIELTSITNPSLVVPTIVQSFGITEFPGKTSLENLADYLSDKKTLLVVDNFEQLVEAAPVFVELLQSAENLKVLITSRVLLNLSIEREYIVPPLALPDKTANLSFEEIFQSEAVKLFVKRSQEARPNFVLSDENAADVLEICFRLDGLPLAVELAAARVKILSPREILAKLKSSFKILTGGAGDMPPRRQTMRNTIEWSYNLLTEEEKFLFRQLAVFSGGFTYESAETIIDIQNDINFLDDFTSLVNKSLVIPARESNGVQRFRVLEVIREYALEHLEKAGEAAEIRGSHAEYFLAFGESAEPHLITAESVKWLDLLEADYDNLRLALAWFLSTDVEKSARLATAIRVFWNSHNYLTEGRKWLEDILEKGENLEFSMRHRLLGGIALSATFHGDFGVAQNAYQTLLAEATSAGNQNLMAVANRGLGITAYQQSDYQTATKFAEAGLEISRRLNDKKGIAFSLNILGEIYRTNNNLQAAQKIIVESLEICRTESHLQGVCVNCCSLGMISVEQNDEQKARIYFAEALEIGEKLGSRFYISNAIDGFAALFVKTESELKRAIRLAGAAEQFRQLSGVNIEPAERLFREKYLSKLKSKINETDFVEFYEQGRKLNLEESFALCLENLKK